MKLLFVYNADSNLFATVTDFAHKILKPDTYACNLCKITYGNFNMKKDWQTFIEQLPCDLTFLHRDEFLKAHPEGAKMDLPAVFSLDKGKVKPFIPADKINGAKNIEDLKQLVNQGLKASGASK
jgi:hypothetical protein